MAELRNQSTVTEFILVGFEELQDLQIPLFLLFLVIYIATMVGNLLIIVLAVTDQHLHTPMYFFLGNLSCLETCYSSTILPKMLANLLTGGRTISVRGCIAQLYAFGILAATECYLLAAMSYDRYLAICKPMHYVSLMNDGACIQLVAGSWMIASLIITILMLLVLQLTFCGSNEIDHFFCDLTPIIRLACGDTNAVELAGFINSSIGILPSFLITLASYICIITTILRIPSTTGRQKAFSTCSSHLIVVVLFYGSLMIVYVLPSTIFSLFYTVLTPLFNPLIYSLRNKEVKEALRKIVKKYL
uniref:Olfactory receptor n=1 Tax=Sphenodon punctatus TaxID=8508 RepID=A0A8D0G8E8_SPHPU